MRIHHPLFLGFTGVVGLLIVLVVALVGTALRDELVGLTRLEVDRQVSLARTITEDAAPGADPDSLVDALSAAIDHRVTLIARDGRLLGDSELDQAGLRAAENHSDRVEVVEALNGSTGFDERLSATVGESFLYMAEALVWNGGDSVVIRVAAPLAGIEATIQRSRRAVAFAGLAAMIVSLLVAYFLSRFLARPLVTLADRAALLAQGDFTRRVPRGARVRELDELALAFNRLTDELQARLQELGRERDEMQALIDCMAEGVVALTDDARILRTNRAARELLGFAEPPLFAPVGSIIRQPELRELLEASVIEAVRAREVRIGDGWFIVSGRLLDQGGAVATFLDITEIKRLEKVRRDFVANASHELKTPLTSMRGFAETLLEDDPPEHLRTEFLSSIRTNTVRLQRLVDDLLDLSRLESGGWVARSEPVELSELAVNAWDDLEEGARPRRDLRFEIEGEGLAMADTQGVEQIFQNLLDNARRYTADGGSVTVRIRAGAESMWIVEVRDTGTGVPSKAIPRIFERFYRADTSRAREVGGTGLGLAIVRHLVQQMGGDVGADSELGVGTTIRFSLPAAEVPTRV